MGDVIVEFNKVEALNFPYSRHYKVPCSDSASDPDIDPKIAWPYAPTYLCTRPEGHGGRHSAAASRGIILATWRKK